MAYTGSDVWAISVVRNFRTTAADGKEYLVSHYNLDMIIALGYRVRSMIATRFRQWTTECLKEYDRILTMSGEQLLQGSGNVSHEEAMEHATTEYRKYKQRTLSDVERDYLFSIKSIEDYCSGQRAWVFWPEFLFVYQQFIPLPSHVHDADAWVGFETAAESGDEYLKAAGVEDVVVAPDFEKEGFCVQGLSFACT